MKQLGLLVAGLLTAGSVWANAESAENTAVLPTKRMGMGQTLTPMSASANTVASRGLVTPSQPMYGGFSLAAPATVYILVRGNSMQTLGVTSNYLDSPRVRIFNQANSDLIQDGLGNPGSNGCVGGSSIQTVVATYYQTRGAAQPRDFCVALNLNAGVYTFTVNASIPGVTTVATTSAPSSGEVLFEVTLGP